MRASKLTTAHKTGNPSVFALANLDLWDQAVHVREGLPASYVAEMSDALAMPRTSYLENLQLPRSTIEARIKKKASLTSAEGDAVLRSAKALAKAEQVFEDHATAAAWFKRSIRSLGGVTPVSLMDTDSGFELVMKTLGRIEHGVVA
jgi:putative toxin-antitoxin system antitoxin component (TIGR02293 family)